MAGILPSEVQVPAKLGSLSLGAQIPGSEVVVSPLESHIPDSGVGVLSLDVHARWCSSIGI